MKVSVITSTIGKPQLANCIESVRKQTYENVEHIIFVDGKSRWDQTDEILKAAEFPYGSRENICLLPYPTGLDRFNGHRIYGASAFIADGDYHIWLDDDNSLEPNHIETLVNLIQKDNLDWAYSFRQIVDDDGKLICYDDCESLGKWASVLNDYFIDLNCFITKKELAVQLAPIWYRKAREPGVMEIDRAISAILMHSKNSLKFDCNMDYTLKYRVGSTGISVKADFFLQGNAEMLRRHNNKLPWKNV